MRKCTRRCLTLLIALSLPALSAFALTGPGGIVAPSGTNPDTGVDWAVGDTYQLVFCTSTTTDRGTGLNPISHWNNYVNTVAAASTEPGVPNVSWYAIGTTASVTADVNAVVLAPVYLLDGTSKIADGHTDMWDGTIGFALNIDENANTAAGTTRVWSGATNDGTHGGYPLGNSYPLNTGKLAWVGLRTSTTAWLRQSTTNKMAHTDSYHFYALSQPLIIVDGSEVDVAAPTVVGFDIPPRALTTRSIEMKAALSYDTLSPPVEYYFLNTVTGKNSGWQTSPSWVDTVSTGKTNTYKVKARDSAPTPNETVLSAPLSSSPLLTDINGVWAPTGMHPSSGTAWKIGDTYHIIFLSSTTADLGTGAHDIDYWNTFVSTTYGATSALSGYSKIPWKVLGSTTLVDAKDNASIAGPVFMLAAENQSFQIATGDTDMWDGSNPYPINIDEQGVAQYTSKEVWTGSSNAGVKVGSRELDAGSITRAGDSRSGSEGAWMSSGTWNKAFASLYRFYVVSEPLTIVGPPGTLISFR